MTRFEAQEVVFYHSELSLRARLVFLALADFTREGNHCWPSISTVAERAGLSISSVYRSIAELIALGLVSKSNRSRRDGGNSSNKYTLFSPSDTGSISVRQDSETVISPDGDIGRYAPESGEGEEQGPSLPTENNSSHPAETKSKTSKAAQNISLWKIMDSCKVDDMPADVRLIFRDALKRLYFSRFVRIGKNIQLPQEVVRDSLRFLDHRTLEEARRRLEQVGKRSARPVLCRAAYIAVLMFNTISEAAIGRYFQPAGQAPKSSHWPFVTPIAAPGPAECAAMERMMNRRKTKSNA